MINLAILDGLKRVNVSADKEKTKVRVESLWKAAPKEIKHRVLDEGSIVNATIYRIFREGSITPKVAVVLANALNADPFYLTGETEDNEGSSEQILDRFLREKGYGNLLDDTGFKPKRKYTRRAPAPVREETEAATQDTHRSIENESIHEIDGGTSAALYECEIKGDKSVASVSINEDDLVVLLRALKLRARFGGEAELKLKAVVDLLVSDWN